MSSSSRLLDAFILMCCTVMIHLPDKHKAMHKRFLNVIKRFQPFEKRLYTVLCLSGIPENCTRLIDVGRSATSSFDRSDVIAAQSMGYSRKTLLYGNKPS